MINANELRLGNYILHKGGVRILPVKCHFSHFDLIAKGQAKDMFPIPLKTDLLEKIGFVENKKYYQSPEVREYILALPVKGVNTNEIRAYINKTETYARATVNELIITNNIHHLHQLQNLYYTLVNSEMEITL